MNFLLLMKVHQFIEQASLAHVMSIVVMVNEKFRESVPPWEVS